jgi:RNA polymerase sigma factor (sigma-70 family)
VVLDDAVNLSSDMPPEVVAVDDALAGLEHIDPFKASLVELKFFGGLTNSEVGEILDCSEKRVRRHWQVAKAWLRRELEQKPNGR